MSGSKKDAVILGGGLSGLSAGYVLTNAGLDVSVFERDTVVGGLAKTIEKNGFRFDLGGHRFFTTDDTVDAFVRDLMKAELITVHRSSKIYLRGKYFDYPLKPLNAMFGMGIPTIVKILADYGRETAGRRIKRKNLVSLQDWVVCNFGRTMFSIYFKEYSEKVWGIDCSRISAEWVAQRIKGLSLATAVKNAFYKVSGRHLPTLTDCFLYPALGIGRISDRLAEGIEKRNDVLTDTAVESVNHNHSRIVSISVQSRARRDTISADECLSSIPITKLVTMLNPAPPARIREIVQKLRFRDLVVVAIMVDRPKVTDQTWIYIPEQKIPFGRIHEPTNWSADMAPAGKSLVVAEFFSFRGDAVWNASDEQLTDITVKYVEQLGFIEKREVLDSMVVRVPKAYPLFEVGYKELSDELYDYLISFSNLHLTGRNGMFRYYNMDIAIKSGIDTAENVIRKLSARSTIDLSELVLADA